MSCKYLHAAIEHPSNITHSVILFAILRILHLPDYLHSADPTFNGIPAAIFAQAQLHASLATCTTPLLKSLILEFNTLGRGHSTSRSVDHGQRLSK